MPAIRPEVLGAYGRCIADNTNDSGALLRLELQMYTDPSITASYPVIVIHVLLVPTPKRSAPPNSPPYLGLGLQRRVRVILTNLN